MSLAKKHAKFIATIKKGNEIQDVDYFWNSEIKYVKDEPNRDTWQAPAETLERGAGDCEDVNNGKYWDLVALGFKPKLNFLKLTSGEYHINCTCNCVTLDNQSLDGEIKFSFDHTAVYEPSGDKIKDLKNDKRLHKWWRIVKEMGYNL